jgi:transposase
MDGIEANSEGRQTAEHGKRIRRRWTTAMKRRIVREAEKPGAVRLEVAQRNAVHASMLNRWRTEMRSRLSGGKKPVRKARLLPIRVSTPQAASRPAHAAMAVAAGDLIEVAFSADRRVTVRGVVDGEVLRAVLQELSRC